MAADPRVTTRRTENPRRLLPVHESADVLHPSDDNVYFFSNLGPEETGVPGFVVWIRCRHRRRYSPYVLVSRPLRSLAFGAAVTIEAPVHVMAGRLNEDDRRALTRWIELNRDVLLSHWRNETDSLTALNALQPVE